MNEQSKDHPVEGPWFLLGLMGVVWLAGGALLRQPFCLEPGRYLYPSDALLTSASAITGSGLASAQVASQFNQTGQMVLMVLTLVGFAGLALICTSLTPSLFRALVPDAPAPSSRVVRVGLFLCVALPGVLVPVLFCLPMAHRAQGLWQACFEYVNVISGTGWSLRPEAFRGVQFTSFGQALLLPLIMLPGLGPGVTGNLAAWMFTLGHQRLHPITRTVITCLCVSFVLGTGLILLAQLAPYAYELMHLGMESGASSSGALTTRAIQDSWLNASFSAGAGRIGAAQVIDPIHAPPAEQITMIGLCFLGLAPLSSAGGVSLLAVGTLAGTGLRAWLGKSAPSGPARALLDWSVSVLVFYLALTFLGVFLLLISEPYPVMTLLAETVSACANAGYSLGVTQDLTSFGKVVLSVLMVLGRVGPIWLGVRVINRELAQTHGSTDQSPKAPLDETGGW